MLNLRLREIARRPNAPFLGAAGGIGSAATLELFELAPPCRRARSPRASARSSSRPSACSSSASAPTSSIAPSAALLAGYERAYKERDKSESPSYANEYVRALPREANRFPASSSSTRSRRRICRRSRRRGLGAARKELITDENRVVLGVAPEKKDAPPPTTERCARDRRAGSAGRAVGGSDAGRALVEKPPAPAR